jgi:Pectate lyase superfamily protein
MTPLRPATVRGIIVVLFGLNALMTMIAIGILLFGARPAHATLQPSSYPSAPGSAMLSCSGRPWIDILCYGADPTDTADSTTAIQTAINDAVANNVPVHFPAGTFKVSTQITIDYAGNAGTGFRLISGGATLDGNSITSGPVLQVECSSGTILSPATCFYFHQEGTLFVQGNSNEVNITTLSSSAAMGATVLNVTSTSSLYVGQTVLVALTGGGTFASSITAIGSGTITIATGLPSGASNTAIVGRPSYVFAMGKVDFSDQHNSWAIDHIDVKNNNSGPGAGACQLNANYDSVFFGVCDSAGGAGGIALEQTQFTKIAGAGSAAATGGQALVLENGYNFSNTFYALDLEVAPICISITDNHHGNNTWISPYMNCPTAVNATASDNNVLINPQYAGATVNYGPQSVGISIIGKGNRAQWQFPAAATYTAAAVDDGLTISSYNAPGASMTVTTPVLSTVNPGWSMAVATDNGKGMTLSGNGSPILAGNKSVSSVTLGPGNYEYVRIESDGNNWRVTNMTRNTALLGGFQTPPWPSNWLYPSTSGYSATLADNGNILSSYNTSAGLSVTLPATGTIPNGWAMGFATDNNKPLSINVTDGHIVWPGSGAHATSLSLASTSQGAYEFLVLQYDNTGSGSNFRVIDATPATWQAIGAAGSAGFSHWSFPSVSAYSAALADNGNVVSSYNSPLSYFTMTLPATSGLPMGWTIGLASDSNKTTSLQVTPGDRARILFPGSGATTASVTLAPNNYEFAGLSFDGTNFRLTTITPQSASNIGVLGTDFSLNRFNFPSVSSYAAQVSDGGNVLSSYNAGPGLGVVLPNPSTLYPGWTMGFMTDNDVGLTVAVNGGAGEKILIPSRGGTSVSSFVMAAGSNYEFVQLKWDGSNYRMVTVTPTTANNLGAITLPTSCASPGSGVLYNSGGTGVKVC